MKKSPKILLEVTYCFKNSMNFTGNLDGLDGKGLIEIRDEDLKKLGLNLGQSKKIMHYINYFKTLKIEEPEEKIKFTKERLKKKLENF